MAEIGAVSRPTKLGHLNTVVYEIDMLNFCYGRLRRAKWEDAQDYYVCIEGFLLHYRNLIQFFGNWHDLKAGIPEVWSPRSLTKTELSSIQDSKPFKQYNGPISQYLSHCTKRRAERDRCWKYIEMYKEIESLLEAFTRLFPSKRRHSNEALRSTDAASTATVSYYDSALNGP